MKRRLVTCGFVLAAALTGLWYGLPFPLEHLQREPASWQLQDREGRPLRMGLTHDGQRAEPIGLEEAGDWVAPALIAAEDKRFRNHSGVDLVAIARSTVDNAKAGRVVSGASTLSTQVIRMSEPRRRTLPTKGIEAFRALQMEQLLEKDEILAQYLNRAPFGSNLVGVQAASRAWFGKEARDLTLGEAALLMGLPQSPARFQPDRHLDRALERRAFVLERMVVNGFITEAQQQEAESQPLDYLHRHHPVFRAPHFCDLVERLRPDQSLHGTVRSTLDLELQQLVEAEAARHAERLDRQGIGGLAVVLLEVKSGAVRAMIGSPDYHAPQHGQVNLAWARRPPGSTLKPFAFALAMDRGSCTPEQVLGDVPMAFRDYDPSNFSRRFHGPVSARDALVESLNIPALKVVQQLGAGDFLDCLRGLGLDSLDRSAEHYGISLALGTAEVRLLNLANAYACLAREGAWRPFRLLEDEPEGPSARRFSPEACFLIADILGGDERALEVTGHAAEVLRPRFAWKTGTSMGFRDAWTVGWNPEYVVAVWAGNPEGGSSPDLIGSRAAAPVVHDLFRRLYPDGHGPWFEQPGVVLRDRCALSGQPCGSHCPQVAPGLVLRGVSDPAPCRVHPRAGAVQWPEEIAAWLGAQRAGDAVAALRITAPVSGEHFRMLTGIENRIALRAEAEGERFWFIDGRFAGSTRDELWWSLEPGRHELVCSTADGQSARAWIQVDGR